MQTHATRHWNLEIELGKTANTRRMTTKCPYCRRHYQHPAAYQKHSSGKCRSMVQGGPERSWSTKGGHGPRGPPSPLWSPMIHTFGKFTENVDQGGSGWTRRTRGTITPLGGPGVVFTFCWCFWAAHYDILLFHHQDEDFGSPTSSIRISFIQDKIVN